MKFQTGDSVLWWDGEFIREGTVKEPSANKSALWLRLGQTGIAYNCDLYYKTPEDMKRLKNRIDELRYKFENLSDGLHHKIEEAKNEVQP